MSGSNSKDSYVSPPKEDVVEGRSPKRSKSLEVRQIVVHILLVLMSNLLQWKVEATTFTGHHVTAVKLQFPNSQAAAALAICCYYACYN